MGNYSIVIHGAGSHDNAKTFDVEQMVDRFIDDLTARGHVIEDARVVIGGSKEIRKGFSKGPELARPIDEHDDLEREARAAYERYGAHAKWKTFDGRQMPDWEHLTDIVRDHWRAAVDWYGTKKKRDELVVGGSASDLGADALLEQRAAAEVTPEPAPLPSPPVVIPRGPTGAPTHDPDAVEETPATFDTSDVEEPTKS
jgi:hypothetical protein